MKYLYRPALVAVVLILIILGLNTSNQGTNSLTAEARKPIFSIKMENKNINVVALGKEYTYSRQDLLNESDGTLAEAKTMVNSSVNYCKKIWTIFRVLFLE